MTVALLEDLAALNDALGEVRCFGSLLALSAWRLNTFASRARTNWHVLAY